MYENRIFMSHFMLKLTDRFQKRLALNISYSPTHLYDGNGLLLRGTGPIKTGLDFIRDMGNHLNGSAAVVTPTFLMQYRPVYFPGGDVGIFIKAFIDKPFIVP